MRLYTLILVVVSFFLLTIFFHTYYHFSYLLSFYIVTILFTSALFPVKYFYLTAPICIQVYNSTIHLLKSQVD